MRPVVLARGSPAGVLEANTGLSETCQGSVPEDLIAFLDAGDFEHTLRLVISLGGDADTQGAIAGVVAETFWGGIPDDIQAEVDRIFPPDMAMVVTEFLSMTHHPL